MIRAVWREIFTYSSVRSLGWNSPYLLDWEVGISQLREIPPTRLYPGRGGNKWTAFYSQSRTGFGNRLVQALVSAKRWCWTLHTYYLKALFICSRNLSAIGVKLTIKVLFQKRISWYLFYSLAKTWSRIYYEIRRSKKMDTKKILENLTDMSLEKH